MTYSISLLMLQFVIVHIVSYTSLDIVEMNAMLLLDDILN